MAKMRQTGLAHATSGAEAVRRSEAGLRYNAAAIKHWIGRTARDERQTEALLARSGLAPLRLSYERMLAMGDAAVLAQVMAHLGRPVPEAAAPSPHHKISGQTSAAAAARFAAEQAPFLARVAARRAPILARLAET